MTIEEIQALFGTTDGYFYQVSRNKTDLEILVDVDQTIHTISNAQGLFVRVDSEITHPDYTRIV